MDKQTALEAVKENLEDYLQLKGINPRKNFKCINPQHREDNDPSMSFDRKANKVHCFGCGVNYDLLDVIGVLEGIEGFPARLQRACDLYGIAIDEEKPRKKVKKTPLEIIRQAQANIEDPRALEYLNKRGISLQTAIEYGLGYDPRYYCGRQREYWEALIIPTGNKEEGIGYLARRTSGKDKDKPAGVPAQIFNAKALEGGSEYVYIMEGEIDALSIIEAGGQAIGLGSTNYTNKLLAILSRFKTPFEKTLILSLDNDAAGMRAAQELREGLSKLREEYPLLEGLKFKTRQLPEGYKDANEALVKDREGFIAWTAGRASRKQEEEYRAMQAGKRLDSFLEVVSSNANTPAVSTGFAYLDEELDGGLYEGLYTIPAISSLGKTTFVLQMADNLAAQGKDVLFISLEMAANELIAKSLSRQTYLIEMERGNGTANAKTERGITDGKRYERYSAAELSLINEAIERYNRYAGHIYFLEGIGDVTTQRIRELVQTHKEVTGNTPIVIVDYLQILAPSNERATDKQNMDKAALELKRISRDYKTPVIAVSSVNRESYYREINLASLKESGAIEYGSDIILGLQFANAKENLKDSKPGDNNAWIEKMKRNDPRQVEVKILKNRHGKTGGSVFFDYHTLFNCFDSTAAPYRGKGAKIL